MGTFNDGDSGSSIRTKINTAIQKTEGTSAISTIDVDGGAIDGVTIGTNSAVTDLRVDNLKADGNTISSTDTNGDVNISPNGTGTVVINTDLDVDNININGNTISSSNTNGDVIIDPNGTGNVKLGNFEFDADQTVGSGQDNYVLTYDHSSTSISLEAAAGGGGGAALYDANESSPSAQPSATGANAIAIGDSAVSNNTQNFAIGHSADAITGTYNTALGPFATANGSFYAVAIGCDSGGNASTAGGSGSFATVGGVTAGNRAHALGNAYAAGIDSFAAVIANRTSSYGATSSYGIAMGKLAKATNTGGVAIGENNLAQGDINASAIGGKGNTASGYYAIASGGQNNTVTGARSGIVAGSGNTASGSNSVILGGGSNTASGQHSYVFGQNSTASENYAIATGYYSKSDVRAKIAHSSGHFSAAGDAQGGQFVLRADTTDATATVLTTTNDSASTNNQIVAASDTCIAFHGTLVAMQNGAQSYGGFKVEGLLVNDGGTTSLAASTVTAIQNSSGWTVALSADNTNNALAVTVTGEAAHNIRWVANISTSEVTYA